LISSDPNTAIVERLAAHRTIGRAPRSELEWLASHGRVRRFAGGEHLARQGQTLEESGIGFEILLAGHFMIQVDRGAGPRRVMDWQGGDIAGVMPFSRMTTAPGDSISTVPVETLSIDPSLFPELIRECPTVAGICVHVMLDRARVFNTNDWQDEKMASLGKLAAGIAHELNNPASAVASSAQQLQQSIADADAAARVLAHSRLSEAQLTAIDSVRRSCMSKDVPAALSTLERADREDAIASWLATHGADDSALEALVDTSVGIPELNELASALTGDDLDAALDWVAAGCAIRSLALENGRAASRISDLVGAMKRLTHMDRAPVPEPMDVEQGLRDTISMLEHKARAKSISIDLKVDADIPLVHAIGGELNQVWMNLVDNALDAAAQSGHVSVTVKAEGPSVVVRVIDDGPGIAPKHKPRVFDPFFTTKPPGSGTGLGLEVARTRVRGNGGDVTFESEPGRTEFRVHLPARQEI